MEDSTTFEGCCPPGILYRLLHQLNPKDLVGILGQREADHTLGCHLSVPQQMSRRTVLEFTPLSSPTVQYSVSAPAVLTGKKASGDMQIFKPRRSSKMQGSPKRSW